MICTTPICAYHKSAAEKAAVALLTFALATGIAPGGTPSGIGRPTSPPANPFLAAEFNNQSHWNDAAPDSTDIAVPKGHFRLRARGFQWLPNETLGIPAYSAVVQGEEVHWFYSGFALQKWLRRSARFELIDSRKIPVPWPDYRAVTPAERTRQARRIQDSLVRGDEAGLLAFLQAQPNRALTAVEDQVAHGVLYSLLTREHAFIGANARGLVRIDQTDPDNPRSRLREPLQVSLADSLFDDAKVSQRSIFATDSVFGLNMSFNGFLVANTVGGAIATLDRNRLEIIDIYRTPNSDELFTNSFATSPEVGGGAVYVASNRAMYRLVVDATGRIRTDVASGAWRVPYSAGERMVGKIADGTGSTPTLMGFGPDEDELVVITDGARRMRLIAFWRNQHPGPDTREPRPPIADQIEVDMGPDIDPIQSEQSVVAYGHYVFVLNGIPATGARPLTSRASYYRGLLTGATRALPQGIAMYAWDPAAHRWQKIWSRADIGTVATVPMISGGSHMVIVNGNYQGRLNDLYQLGFDLDTGKTVMSIATGADPRFNGAFTGIKCDRHGALMYTTLLGLVRFDTQRMIRVPAPFP